MISYGRRALWWALVALLVCAVGYLLVNGAWKLVVGIGGAAAALFGLRSIPKDVKEEADVKAKEIRKRGTSARNADILDRLCNGPPKG